MFIKELKNLGMVNWVINIKNKKMENYTEKEVYELVEKIMERPDDVIDYLQNENSKHDIQSMIDNAK